MAAGFLNAALPLFVVPMLVVLAVLFAQRAVHVAPEKLALKWSRISPLATARQKFGREGLFEFGKSFAKLLTVALILGVQLSRAC
jgi:flagellar biosynthetic protein FlhB